MRSGRRSATSGCGSPSWPACPSRQSRRSESPRLKSIGGADTGGAIRGTGGSAGDVVEAAPGRQPALRAPRTGRFLAFGLGSSTRQEQLVAVEGSNPTAPFDPIQPAPVPVAFTETHTSSGPDPPGSSFLHHRPSM